MKCNKKSAFLEASDIAGNVISIRKADIVAYGAAEKPEYSSYVVVQGTPSGDARFFLKATHAELKELLS